MAPPTQERLLELPPIPPEMKAVVPFLQRADELKFKDPVIAYWCAYHAAQVGISLPPTPAVRSILSSLLTTLELMKVAIEPNDAISSEPAAAAYVENFALRVFARADDEDRKGEWGRGTAKKFHAAAHFLEVLAGNWPDAIDEGIEEKIKYAKWKAVDIARALRENRKPISGPAIPEATLPPPPPPDALPSPPAGFVPYAEIPTHSTSPGMPAFDLPRVPGMAPSSSPPRSPRRRSISPPKGNASPPRRSSASPKRVSPPPPQAHSLRPPARPYAPQTPPRGGDGGEGTWSTAATPGSSYGPGSDMFDETPVRNKRRSGSSRLKNAIGGSGSEEGSEENEVQPARYARDGYPYPTTNDHNAGGAYSRPGAAVSPDYGAGSGNGAGSTMGLRPPYPNGPLFSSLSPPDPAVTPLPPSRSPSVPSTPSLPTPTLPSQPPLPPSPPAVQPAAIPSAPPYEEEPDPELSPQQIARAQRHCRFAISALDYEDAAQARRELLSALEVLGMRL
ncbi:hypothetical protein PLICRDRAFT_382100 [Plicaturopsis crispa FD-325 SS-3]|nr:hypothetical protein PLICRDRAFT_382100 [Plicaturopsis crispa FD-325 SS-3]